MPGQPTGAEALWQFREQENARRLPGGIYGWFTQCSDTRDLRQAADQNYALLSGLSSTVPEET